MKLLLENWQEVLNEDKKKILHQLYALTTNSKF